MNSEANKQISVSVDKYLSLLHEFVVNSSKQQTSKRRQEQHAEMTTIKMKLKRESRTISEDLTNKTMDSNELASWRRLNNLAADRQQSTRATGRGQGGAVRVLVCVALIMFLVVLNTQTCESRELSSQMTFVPSVQLHHQQQLQLTSAPTTQITTATSSLLDRCKIGAPLQWRPYLDASNKAYLAPVVAIASLEHFALSPMQLATGVSSQRTIKSQTGATNDHHHLRHLNQQQQQQPESLLQHAQSVNNAGVLIEATFQVRNVLRRQFKSGTGGDSLQAGRLINLHYKVSASLATTSDIIALANSLESQLSTNSSSSSSQTSTRQNSYSVRPPTAQPVSRCALELTESELSKKGGDLFKVGRDYVLFLESAANVARKSRQQQQQQHQQQQQQQQVANVAAILDQWWLPFASHEPANNQTVRSVNRVLCKNCVRPPTVRLVNSTFVSVATNQQQQESQTTSAPGRRRIKLDCRVSGNPTPWVEWFRYGKPLRNKSGRTRIKTSVWKGRPNERLSRLELELATGRNETGVYECRAMSVAAREPAVGTYKLLMLPAQFALVPMQQDSSGSNELGDEQQRRRGQISATKTNINKADERDTKSPINSMQTSTVAATVATSARPVEWAGSTTTTPAPQLPPHQKEQQQQHGGSSNGQPNEEATRREGANQNGATGQTPQEQQNSSKSSPVVVGQPCPGEAQDNFCLNRGTCVLIGHIEEYFCNCAEGYHGHRCEYKSLGHQQNSH